MKDTRSLQSFFLKELKNSDRTGSALALPRGMPLENGSLVWDSRSLGKPTQHHASPPTFSERPSESVNSRPATLLARLMKKPDCSSGRMIWIFILSKS